MPFKIRYDGKIAQKNALCGIQTHPQSAKDPWKTALKGIPVTEIQLQNSKRTETPPLQRAGSAVYAYENELYIKGGTPQFSECILNYCTSLWAFRQVSYQWKALKMMVFTVCSGEFNYINSFEVCNDSIATPECIELPRYTPGSFSLTAVQTQSNSRRRNFYEWYKNCCISDFA